MFFFCFFQAEKDLERISGKVENLKRQREECHEKLGDVKSLMSFIMQAVGFWDEVVTVTKEATVKTEHIQRIVDLAAKKNALKILRSSGTQTMMKSFKDGWMEVAEMITSDRNNVILEKVYTTCIILLTSTHHFFPSVRLSEVAQPSGSRVLNLKCRCSGFKSSSEHLH